MKKRKKIKKTKAQDLIDLMKNPKTREMIENTDRIGGRLRSGDKKCTI
jgi:hypothetical protein